MSTKIVYKLPKRVENNYEGLNMFADMSSELKDISNGNIHFDFSENNWFEANLVSILAAIVEKLKERKCKVHLYDVDVLVQRIFKKNGFYDYYNLGKLQDSYDTTIPFEVFNVLEDEKFTSYLDNNVLPIINLKLGEFERRKFKNSLQEVFVNTNEHAESENVYTCGQYYYKKKKAAFTIVDTGVTIGKNVRKLRYKLSDSESIDWATQFGNTTKVNEVGGIGLHLITQYLKNNGSLQILSGNGYWEYNGEEVHKIELDSFFNGTIVNIVSKFDTNVTENFSPTENNIIF